MNIDSPTAARGLAIAQATEAMLRSLGGREITMLLPMRLEPGDCTGALEEVPVAPAVLRSTGEDRFELLLGAKTANLIAEVRGFETADALFQAVVGFERGETLLRIATVGVDTFAGEPYLYRLTLVA
ncbi:MAG TPA: hypothetical protein VMS96_06525 [Terriglobales bacterium]|nr:hypothetical protein [Terriglobales bacterium]